MKTHSRFVCKAQTKANAMSKKKIAIGLTSLLLLAAGMFYSFSALADTNLAGVKIEYINEPNLLSDPVQELLADMDAAHESATDDTTDNDLWARIKDGYELPDVKSPYTSTHEQWYSTRPDYIQRMMERSQRYLFHIVEEVQKRGMPTEIALLPMIESAFNPQAYSRSKASGIWQFVPATGKHFGLQQNWWVDNRRDVTAATDAALDYLQKLHGMFGSWDLALAAYNAGEGTVQRAIDKNRRLGLATNYQSLSLPPETRNYVPKLQAIKNIVTDPGKYGLNIAAMPNRPYFARVTTPKQIDAKLAAQLAEISYEEFSALNPSYNRPIIISTITSQGEKHQLLLPVWAAERFVDNLASYDKPLTSWQTYSAKRGERVDSIAKKFGTNVSSLRTVNSLPSSGKLRTAQTMLVPATYSATYNVSADNNVETINASDLMVNNHASNNIEIDVNADEPKATHRIIHKVKKGETLNALAARYDTSTQSLKELNGLRSTKVKVGQNLTIKEGGFKKASFKTTKANANRKSIRSKHIKTNHKSSKRIRARSHIRLK
jgi:membrane-bound lytic murein transglycosylase D